MKKLILFLAIVVCMKNVSAQLTGTFTIDNTLPASSTNFVSFTSAIDTLNFYGVGTGGVIFEVPAGALFTELTPFITATGTATNPIVFQRTGTGVNPLLTYGVGTGTAAASSTDAVIRISGGDYITFDGIDVRDNPANSTNATRAEYGYLIRNATATNGCHNITIKNCRITLTTASTLTIGLVQSAVANPGVGVTPTAFSGTNSNNKYINVKIENCRAGMQLAGNAAILDYNNEVFSTPGDSMVIKNLGANEANFGVRGDNQARLKIHDIRVHDLVLPGISRFDGIYLNNAPTGTLTSDTCEIYNNLLYNLNRNSTSSLAGTVSGITSTLTANATSVCRIYNNVVYNIQNATTSVSGRKINGMLIQASGGNDATHFIDNNTVEVNATNLVYNNTCFEAGTSAATNLVLRNNIFVNRTAAQSGAAIHHILYFGQTSTQFYGPGSMAGNNIYYLQNTTNGVIGFGANATRFTLNDWKNAFATTIENNSRQDNPMLNADLTVSTTSPTAVEGNAVPVSWIPVDHINGLRNATTPDVGAFEGTYITNSTTHDYGLFSIGSPVNFDTTGAGVSIEPAVIVQNNGTLAQTNIPVVLRVINTSTLSLQHVDTVFVSLGGNQSMNAIFDTFSIPTIGTYQFNFSLVFPLDLVPVNDTASVFLHIDAPFNGTYAVGIASPFPFNSLTSAVNRLNMVGATGPVTFELMDSEYNITKGEVFPIILRSYKGLSATNRLTIKPGSSVNTRISGTSATFIKFEGVDYATLDGSNDGTSGRNLTVEFTSNTSSSAAIWITAQNQSNGAHFNTVKNCIVKGFPSTTPTDPSPTNWYGVYFGLNTGINSSTGSPTPNNNNTIRNNYFVRFQTPVTVIGNGILFPDSGNVFESNKIGDDTLANANKNNGMNIQHQKMALINGNDISGNYNRETTIGGGVTGIILTNCMQTTISRNKIHNLYQSGSTSSLSYGIRIVCTSLNTISNPSENIIHNNFIYDIRANCTNTWSVSGICLSGGYGEKVYFNTVYLNGLLNNISTGSGGAACFSNGHGFGTAGNDASSAEVVKNNIFVMHGVSTGATKMYAIYFKNATTTGEYNNNLYAAYKGGNSLPFISRMGSDYLSVAAWNTASSQDAQSLTDTVEFVSATDLHLTGNSLGDTDLVAVPIVGLTTDIDNELRNALYPYKGADEGLLNPLPVTWLKLGAALISETDAAIEWEVIEYKNKQFEVEVSNDGKVFTTLQEVPSTVGTSVVPSQYSYVHADVFKEVSSVYYRIKQVDVNGNTSYSNTLVLNKKSTESETILTPNPIHAEGVFTFSGMNERASEVDIYTTAGILVSHYTKGQIVTAPSKPGVYIIRIALQDRIVTQKVIVQ